MVTVLRAFATTHEAGAVAITFSEMEKKKRKKHERAVTHQSHATTKQHRPDSNPDSTAPKPAIITIMPSSFLTAPQMCSLTFS